MHAPRVFIQPSKLTTSARGALAGLSLSMLLSSLATSIANVGLPTLAQSLAAPFQDVQWVVLVYLLAITTLIVGAGRVGDVVGRRRMLLAGIALFMLASLVCSAAPTLWVLIAGRAMQGIGAAMMLGLTMTFVSEIVPQDRTGSAMGLLSTMSAVGTALGPSLGGALIAFFGWRSIFIINLPLGLIALLLVVRFLPADRTMPRTGPMRFDVPGTILLAVTLAGYALATTAGRGQFGALNAVLLAGAAIAGGLFVIAERRASAPLIRLAMIRDRSLGSSLVASLLVAAVVMTTLVVGPFYLSGALGLDAAVVGLIVGVGPLVVALAGVPAGRLADRLGARRVMIAGLAALAAGSALLAALPPALGIPGYVVPLIVITAGYALFQTANSTIVMADAPRDQRGVISGLVNLSRNLGLITGAAAMGAVFANAAGPSDIATAAPAAIADGMRMTFAVAATLMVAAILTATAGRAVRT